MRRRPGRIGPLVSVIGLVAVAAPPAVAAPVDRDGVRQWLDVAGTARAPVPARREVVVVLRVEPAAVRKGARGSNRAYRAALRAQERAIAELRERGLDLHVRARYARVLNAIVVDALPDGVARLAADPAVEAVFPVRSYAPAGIVADALPGLAADLRPRSAGAGAGKGVTVALLDGPIDRQHPLLKGRVVRKGPGLAPARRDAAAAHATAMAAIVAGRGGPDGLTGVAPAARILALDVLRPDADGSLSATTRSVLNGLERAADPNNDGDLADRARVVLAPLSARFASFQDGAEEHAARGLAALGAVVVAPAGNDGPSGLSRGTTGLPAAAPSVLAVGAVDGRAVLPRIQLTLGGEALEGTLAGPVAPASGLVLPVHVPGADGSGAAGAAALVERDGGDVRAQVLAAAQAGASAILLWGRADLAPGGLGVDDRLALPIVSLAHDAGARISTLLAAGGSVDVAFGTADGAANPEAGRVAGFSSTGLGGDGRVKPDVVMPGVAVVTALAGGGLTSVTGTSAAAAQAAGTVAALAASRPRWAADVLRGAVVSTAKPVADAVAAQGAGLPDLAIARGIPLLVGPSAVAFGVIDRATGTAQATVAIRNVSADAQTVHVGFEPDAAGGASVTATPSAFAITPGAGGRLELTLRLEAGPLGGDVVGGWLTLTTDAGLVLRVPVAAIVASGAPKLVRGLKVERPASDPAGAIVGATVGAVRAGKAGAVRIAAVERLIVDVEQGHRRLGRLYEARQLLPGRYRFRLPRALIDGQPLEPGRYRLRVTATGSDGARTIANLKLVVPASG